MKKIKVIVFCILAILLVLVMVEKNRILSSDTAPKQMEEDTMTSKHDEVQIEGNNNAENTTENKSAENTKEDNEDVKPTEENQNEKTAEEKQDEQITKDKQEEKTIEDKQNENTTENKQDEKVTEEKQEDKTTNDTKQEEKVTEDKVEKPAEDNKSNNATENKKNEKTVYLTFDDGPTASSLEILDILDKYKVKATFFMLEPGMKAFPDAVKRTVKDGHGVGLHGVTHDVSKFYQSPESALKEMQTAQETLLSITGVKTNLIRTPYGSIPYLTDSFRKVLRDNKFILWDWNVDSDDWSASNKNYVQDVIDQLKTLDPSKHAPIILMHDRSGTVAQLPELLNYLQKNNYQTEIIDNELESYSFECHDRCYPHNSSKAQ
ncbi:polysaccharide deacetylase family protein [Niallia taxi]|uniref:polysaccharide deacetylase family protein n=1 Tax=Niallia taxi TaxID=2499688 RepID=UPI0015F527A4|nr:polysaccharide deacetylase family protein [Niallia taxi]MED4039974.1 polysaccharide deacetylase family protein [Niallia taxi]